MITRENYEIYFMDYLDGTLPDEYREELKAFLLVNPDLRELLDGMNRVRLRPGQEVFGKKEGLKQQVSGKEIAYHAIAEMEGVITPEEKLWVRDNVEEKVFAGEVEAYRSVRVIPDSNCIFGKKEELRRRPAMIVLMKRYAGVAAVAIFAIVLVMYITREEDFSVDDLSRMTVKAELPALPETPDRVTKVEEVIPATEEQPRVPVEAKIVASVPVQRVEPVSSISSEGQIVVPVEILAPRPDEMLVSPYEGVEIRPDVQEPRERSFRLIASDLENSDNVLSSIVNVGRNVVNQIRSRDKKEDDRL